MSANIKIVRVQDVMKKQLDFVDGLKLVSDAINEMKHVSTKTLVVNKRNDDDEYGMVVISDIAHKVLAENKSPDRVNIYEIMTKPVISVCTKMDIRYAARLLQRFNLSRAPVVEDGEIVGIVSLTDMVLKGLCDKDMS